MALISHIVPSTSENISFCWLRRASRHSGDFGLHAHSTNRLPIQAYVCKPVPPKKAGSSSFHDQKGELLWLFVSILHFHWQLPKHGHPLSCVCPQHNIGLAEMRHREHAFRTCSEIKDTAAPVSTSTVSCFPSTVRPT